MAESFVPEVAALDSARRERLVEIAENTLSARPAAVQRQIRLFVRALDAFSLLRYGRRLAGLDHARRTRLLEGFQDSSIGVLRRGVWGLRTLAFMGYYTDLEVQRSIGYRATAAGWEARR